MQIYETKDGMEIKNIKDFDIVQVFECGQAFRWNSVPDGYRGVANGKLLNIKKTENSLIFMNVGMEEFNSVWVEYFDLKRDYGEIKASLVSNDEKLQEAVYFGSGIRILKQDFWEVLISFIISSNNNIPRIKKIIERISAAYGERIESNEGEFFSFPSVEVLSRISEEELQGCGCGYRADYIRKTAGMVRSGEISYEIIKEMSYEKALKTLLKCPGVGKKVADCVLLFSAGKYEAFPVDVWIMRAMNRIYETEVENDEEIRKFASQKFGPLAGFAQQYLFYHEMNL